ncbi:MAG: hypothetical protein IJB41_00830, partial [Clostridia bacterium]|nr:hypothetical protein [Clostridia bacterium]
CKAALAPGGCIALSFNTNTLPRRTVLDQLAKAGFEPMQGDVYEGLAHWVEQAVTRDVCFGVKRSGK